MYILHEGINSTCASFDHLVFFLDYPVVLVCHKDTPKFFVTIQPRKEMDMFTIFINKHMVNLDRIKPKKESDFYHFWGGQCILSLFHI